MAMAIRYQEPLSLVMYDLDFFKHINDTFGHPEGDRILKTFADILQHGTRKSDIVARIGGEEFALLLPKTSLVDAKRVVERIHRHQDASGFRATASGGIATYPIDGSTETELLQSADRALYAAKNAGRDRIFVACEQDAA
jgi:diguanylate cyclase (GGDEF)-like protein